MYYVNLLYFIKGFCAEHLHALHTRPHLLVLLLNIYYLIIKNAEIYNIAIVKRYRKYLKNHDRGRKHKAQ